MSAMYRKESTVTRKESTVTRKESTATRKESTVTRKESTVTRKESTVNRRPGRTSASMMFHNPLYDMKRWQDAINRVSLNLKRKTSGSTRGGSFHSDSEDHDGPKQPPVAYENTYQLEPKDTQRFPTKKAEDVIKAIFTSNLSDKKYNSDHCKNLTTQLTELIRTQVKQELGLQNRFKIVVLVMVGSMKGQGVRCASRCLWYPQFDRFASYSYHNEHLFAVGTVYGVYYE